MPKVFLPWLIGAAVAAAVAAGALVVRTLPWARPAVCEYPYGVDYETCVQCITSEASCEQIWGEGRQPYRVPTPTPNPTSEPAATPTPTRSCNDYAVDEETCRRCNPTVCDALFGRRTSPAPTPTPTPTKKPQAGSPSPTAESTPTPTPTPSPTSEPLSCNYYDTDYATCLRCMPNNQAFCDELFN